MSRLVWSAEHGWHDGPEVDVGLKNGRLVTAPNGCSSFTPSGTDYMRCRGCGRSEGEHAVVAVPWTDDDTPDHDCTGEVPCYGHPDCRYNYCDTCGRPNGRCACDEIFDTWRDQRYERSD